MRTQAHGEHQRDFSQFCRYHGFQLRAWAPRCPVHPPAWPRRGFPLRVASLTVIALPEVEKGWGAAPGAAGQQDSCSISSWRHGHPTPALASPILRVSPHPPGWPACPAPLPGPGWALVHLSGTRCLIKAPHKQGQPAGVEGAAGRGGGAPPPPPRPGRSEPRLASGHFWSLLHSFPKKTRVWAT